MLAFVPLPPRYSPTQPPACQVTLNVTKPRPFTHLAAKLFATSSKILINEQYSANYGLCCWQNWSFCKNMHTTDNITILLQWVSFVLRPPRRTVYSTQHALRLADRQYSVDSVRMTDRHLFTAAEGKHAEGTRMPVGRKTNETHCIIPLRMFAWDPSIILEICAPEFWDTLYVF